MSQGSRWSIIFADTDFFQQSESVSAANSRGRLNWASTFYQSFCRFLAPDCFGAIELTFLHEIFNGFWWTFAEFWMAIGIICKHFGTVTQCSVHRTVPVLLTAKPLETSQKPNSRKISICIDNRPISFHDQTIFLNDWTLYNRSFPAVPMGSGGPVIKHSIDKLLVFRTTARGCVFQGRLKILRGKIKHEF